MKAKCLEGEYIWGRGQRGSGFIEMDRNALRDKGVGTRAKNFGGKECSREELSVYLRKGL